MKRIRSFLALAVPAAIVAVTILLDIHAAGAAPNTANTCLKKYNGCLDRCRSKFDINILGSSAWADKVIACSTRTCSKQYNNCMSSATSGGGTKLDTPGGHKPRPDQAPLPLSSKDEPVFRPTKDLAPLGTGILDSGSGMGGNGPSATGSPAGGGMKPPSAPPVILR